MWVAPKCDPLQWIMKTLLIEGSRNSNRTDDLFIFSDNLVILIYYTGCEHDESTASSVRSDLGNKSVSGYNRTFFWDVCALPIAIATAKSLCLRG